MNNPLSWITLHPNWYANEVQLLNLHYPQLRIDEQKLRKGHLCAFGDLEVNAPKGTKRYSIALIYPPATPFELPWVIPLQESPEWNEDGGCKNLPEPLFLDHRHQMHDGHLCLFQKESITDPGGDFLTVLKILSRAEKYLLAFDTGRWPPDTAESELESHFETNNSILIPSSFLDPKLTGFGRFFYVTDYTRLYKGSPPALVLTAMTSEGALIKYADARFDLSFVFPWIAERAWNADKLATARDLGELDKKASDLTNMGHGYWWSLTREPDPFHDGKGLLSAIENNSSVSDAWGAVTEALKTDFSMRAVHHIGLQYPSRSGGMSWLIIRLDTKFENGIIRLDAEKRPVFEKGIIRSEAEKRTAFESGRVSVVRSHELTNRQLTFRNTSVVRPDIAKKKIALIGLGAIGSKLAELLAQAGIGKFYLCDSDDLEVGNVARHLGGVGDFGATKSSVVISRLVGINPYLRFIKWDYEKWSATSSDRITAIISESDLVICTTADENIESFVNLVATLQGKPVLYGRSLRKGSMGRVFLVRTGQDACKACLSEYCSIGRKGQEVPDDWIDVPAQDDEVLFHECGRPVIAGSAVDLSFIASIVARVALDYLEGKDIEHNHWIWSQSPVPEIDQRLNTVMQTFTGKINPFDGCGICQEPKVREVLILSSAYDEMKSLVESSPDAETGGVLVGFLDGQRRLIILKAIGPGPNAERSRTIFRRDVGYVQGELDKAMNESGSRGQYVGEWHSHLVSDPTPSTQDIDSLFGIANAHHYLCSCPAMLIFGYDSTNRRLGNVLSWVFPLTGRMFKRNHRVITNSESDDMEPV